MDRKVITLAFKIPKPAATGRPVYDQDNHPPQRRPLRLANAHQLLVGRTQPRPLPPSGRRAGPAVQPIPSLRRCVWSGKHKRSVKGIYLGVIAGFIGSLMPTMSHLNPDFKDIVNA